MTLDVCLFFKVSSLLEPSVAAAVVETQLSEAQFIHLHFG